MGGLVQQPAPARAHRQYSTRRGRSTLLCSNRRRRLGGMTQPNQPPESSARFKRLSAPVITEVDPETLGERRRAELGILDLPRSLGEIGMVESMDAAEMCRLYAQAYRGSAGSSAVSGLDPLRWATQTAREPGLVFHGLGLAGPDLEPDRVERRQEDQDQHRAA